MAVPAQIDRRNVAVLWLVVSPPVHQQSTPAGRVVPLRFMAGSVRTVSRKAGKALTVRPAPHKDFALFEGKHCLKTARFQGLMVPVAVDGQGAAAAE